MKAWEHVDMKQHLEELYRIFLPIFVLVATLFIGAFVLIRKCSETSPGEKFIAAPEAARIGLLKPGEEAVFDPAFAIASPIELVRAPTAVHWSAPVGSEHAALTYNANPFLTDRHLGDDINGIGGWNSDLGDPVRATADGLVSYAGWAGPGWGNVVILLHELPDGKVIQSFYGHLEKIDVAIGRQLRRGDFVGTIGTADGRYLAHLHFEVRVYDSIDPGVGYADSRLGRLAGELMLGKWRNRPDDRLSEPVSGIPPEPQPISVKGSER
ncbi:MAG: M23 family metallopeptidase [Verrucomicrobiota bacterium]